MIPACITISIEALNTILRLIVHSITISIKDLHAVAILIAYCIICGIYRGGGSKQYSHIDCTIHTVELQYQLLLQSVFTFIAKCNVFNSPKLIPVALYWHEVSTGVAKHPDITPGSSLLKHVPFFHTPLVCGFPPENPRAV